MKIDYSPRERELLAVIRAAKKKRLTTTELMERVFKEEVPFNARQSISATLSSLTRKVRARGESFSVKKSSRRGPRPIQVWLEEKGR